MANPWDNLTEKFDTNKPADEINAAAADNIMVLWPPIINEINKNFPNKGGLTALDFGCGSGGFAEKLAEMGFDVLGVDSSEGMIETSRKNYPDIKFEKDITGEFNLITAIMVFQFINDVQTTLEKLIAALKQGGLLFFAVHNPEYVELSKQSGHYKDGVLNLDGTEVPIYVRNANDYNEILTRWGMKKIYEDYPAFTQEYLAKYPSEITSVSEYLLLG